MLNHFKRKLAKTGARGKGRTDTSHVRGLVERLEERAMLSTSYGGPGHGYGGADLRAYSVESPQRFGDSAAFASQQQRSMSADSQTFYTVHETSPAYRDFQDPPMMQSAIAPTMRVSDAVQLRPAERGWNEFGAAPPRDNRYSGYMEIGYSLYMPSAAPDAMYASDNFEYDAESAPIVPGTHPQNNDFGASFPPAMKATATPIPSAVTGGDLRQNLSRGFHSSYPSVSDYNAKVVATSYGTTLGLDNALTNVGLAASDLPVISQILSRDANTSTVLSAVAREVAFQEFSQSLFQMNGTTAYDRVNVDAIGMDAVQAELADGWIHPADESGPDAGANSSDAVARERAAVDDVLERLEDVDTLLPAVIAQDINSESNLQTETALDDLPAGEVDGGMVLLRATGDANTSGFDLTPVDAEHVGRFNMPAQLETSVGMLQAMDVASEDAPLVETVQQADLPTQLKRDTRLEDKLPTKSEQSSTSKAATLVGVTTLTGALVWIDRNGSQVEQPKSTAKKRCASQG
jgi:hypothetical protein